MGVETASPYQDADFEAVGRALRSRGAEIVVIDGMAYRSAHKQLVATASGLPTILAASAVAKVLGELVV
ncbi:MAG: AroM family protein [Armatimonadota bacterium]